MDQNLLEQLEALNRLRLPPDLVRELIEHDKWKTREQHRHEKELALLGVLPAKPGTPGETDSSVAAGNDDDAFNSATSGGVCERNHIGLIAKTKVMTGAAQRARDVREDTELPIQLLTLLIATSWCGQRLARWPQASDAKVALGLRNDLEKVIDKYGARTVLDAVDHVSQHLEPWDPRIVIEQLDTLRTEYEQKRALSISSSPLFAEFHKNYPHIDPDTFDECYNQHSGQFVTAAIYMLRREFKNTPPSELSHINGWKQGWQQYLPTYLKQWQEDLRKMETRMRIAQRAWKESIS